MDPKHRRDYAFMTDDKRAVTHDEQMFSGALSFCRRAYARDLAGYDVAVLGVPFDAAVTGRPGARFGPRAIREASANLAWSRAWPSAFDPFERMAVADAGDLNFHPARAAEAPKVIEAAITDALREVRAVLMLGGDHFTTYPALKAVAAKAGGPLALIQFDAHSDTWAGRAGEVLDHGTMFHRAIRDGVIDPVRSVQIGIRTTNDDPMGVEIIDAPAALTQSPEALAQAIRARVGEGPAYLTFDIDCLDPAFAPGTGTPVVGGLESWRALAILRGLAGLRLAGADVVEVAPAYDHAGITALAGATVALQQLCLLAESP